MLHICDVCHYMCVYIHVLYTVCVLPQELERAFVEARAQVESGAIDYGGESEEEPTPEVSMHDRIKESLDWLGKFTILLLASTHTSYDNFFAKHFGHSDTYSTYMCLCDH